MTKRTLRLGALALAIATPATAGSPAHEAAAPTAKADFAEHFAAFKAPARTPSVGDSAVDITTIQPSAKPKADKPVALLDTQRVIGSGRASFYASEFHGRRTASGARFDMHALTAAHRTLPFGSRVRVTNERNGRSVVVTINDRGPFHDSRIMDVSRAAAERLAMVNAGSARVKLELVRS
jgi:rare lipoprotein A